MKYKGVTSTVNVIEYFNGTIQEVNAFNDDPTGNAEAELLFERKANENGMLKADLDDCLAEGIFEEGDYQVFLVHSSNIKV